jgi:hypothetical protein
VTIPVWARRLPLFVLACVVVGYAATARCGPTEPHGSWVAHRALSAKGFSWYTYRGERHHLHYLRGSSVSGPAKEVDVQANAALRHDLALMDEPPPAEPLELFFVDTPEQARRLTGSGATAQAIPGELTVFFVSRPGDVGFRHEIMHALTLARWGTHRAGSWLSEGVAVWAAGTCQGKSVDAIAAGFLQRGELLPLPELAARFGEVDEHNAQMTAGSAVGFVVRTRGKVYVEALWKYRPALGEHPLGPEGAVLEREWRAHLATVRPATVHPERLRRRGC